MCKQECGPYKELKQEYGKVSRIILQPHGVHGINSQLKYCLQYDVKMQSLFQVPDTNTMRMILIT